MTRLMTREEPVIQAPLFSMRPFVVCHLLSSKGAIVVICGDNLARFSACSKWRQESRLETKLTEALR